jgi:amino acid transporter
VDSPAAPAAAIATAVPPRLEPDAIGVAQDTVIGLANAAPAVSIALTIATLVGATAYASGASILICAIPMIIIANAYRRLNMWNANCGTSFEWVGRAINPYLGFMTGWLIIAGITIGTAGTVVVLGPSVLAVFGANATSKWGNTGIAVGLCLVMLIIVVLGIRLTARTQVGMAVVEYVILIGFAIWGFHAVLSHHPGTVPITRAWFTIHGIGGTGSLAGGLIAAIFMFSGWEGTLYVNEEVKHRRLNPGRAAITATVLLAVIYVFSTLGLQGAIPAKVMQTAPSPVIAIGQALGGSGWSKVIALAIALSTIATVGTGILLAARIMYGMAVRQVLPALLGNVSRRFSTPANASIVAGAFLIGVTCVYLLVTSLQNAFSDVIDVTSDLTICFYAITTLATVVYYRRRIVTKVGEALTLGILPVAAIAFLIWVLYKQLSSAPADQIWSLVGIVGVGVLLMLGARFILRSPFFQLPLESDRPEQPTP